MWSGCENVGRALGRGPLLDGRRLAVGVPGVVGDELRSVDVRHRQMGVGLAVSAAHGFLQKSGPALESVRRPTRSTGATFIRLRSCAANRTLVQSDPVTDGMHLILVTSHRGVPGHNRPADLALAMRRTRAARTTKPARNGIEQAKDEHSIRRGTAGANRSEALERSSAHGNDKRTSGEKEGRR